MELNNALLILCTVEKNHTLRIKYSTLVFLDIDHKIFSINNILTR